MGVADAVYDTPFYARPNLNAAAWVRPVHVGHAAGLEPAFCVVCGAVLPRSFPRDSHAHDPYPSCHAVACRMVVSRREEMGEAGFKHYLQMQARHKQHLAAMAQASRARKLAEVEENASGWSALRATLPAALMPEPLRLLLPSGPRQASRLSSARRERYRAHLQQIVAEAHCIDPVIPKGAGLAVNPPGGSTMPGRLCALCGGGCCTRGGDKAYLSAATMRRFMDAQPELTADQVVTAYLDRVTVKTQTRSCINHTGQGCSLPKEMRSDICTRFSCESLARLQAAQRSPEVVQAVLVVRRKQDHWHRAEPGADNAVNAHAVLCETGARRFVRAASPASAPD
jgi:hypothetical protein